MTNLKRYNVQAQGRRGAMPTVIQLSDEDAKARGLTEKDLVDAKKPAKSSSGSTRAKKTTAKRAPAKGRKAPANKQAAPAANKSGAPASTPAAPPAPPAE